MVDTLIRCIALLTQLSHSRGCVTPAQIQNLKDSIEDNLDYLDGYDEIGPELQEKVERALKQGHVDDSDWFGVCLK